VIGRSRKRRSARGKLSSARSAALCFAAMICELCDPIGEVKTITTEEYDASHNLTGTIDGRQPDTFPALENVSASVRRCPRCGTHYGWTWSEESVQGGPEKHVLETMRRLADDAARELIEKERTRP